MEIYDIQIGDRVQCIKKYELVREGETGTVCNMKKLGYYDLPIGVCWDDNIGGHNCDNKCPYGHGYYVPLECITRITEEDEGELDLDPGMGLI